MKVNTHFFIKTFRRKSSTVKIYINIYMRLKIKMSNQNLFKKTIFYIKPVIFRLVQKPS